MLHTCAPFGVIVLICELVYLKLLKVDLSTQIHYARLITSLVNMLH